MKRFLLFTASFFLASFCISQTNSVLLKDGYGHTSYFSSITAAYNAIPASIDTSYIIEITREYNGTDISEIYPITLFEKNNPSTYSITIRPSADNIHAIIQRPTPVAGILMLLNGGDYITIDGRPGGTDMDSSHYMLLLDLSSGGYSTNSNIQLMNGASHNIIEYLKLTAAAIPDILGSRIINIGAGTGFNDYNIIRGCIISGGFRSIQDNGLNSGGYNTGNIITENIIRDFGSPAIFAGSYQTAITIRKNLLQNHGGIGPSFGLNLILQQSFVGGESFIEQNTIDLDYPANVIGNMEAITVNQSGQGITHVRNNKIINFNNPTARFINGISVAAYADLDIQGNEIDRIQSDSAEIAGISIGPIDGYAPTLNIRSNNIRHLYTRKGTYISAIDMYVGTGTQVNITNNMIALSDSNLNATNLYGILIGGLNRNNYSVNMYYNTVSIGGQADTSNSFTQRQDIISCAIAMTDTSSFVYNQQNNITINNRMVFGAGINTCFYYASSAYPLSLDYNTYYATGGNSNISWRDSDFTDLTSYQEQLHSLEQHSNFAYVSFVATDNLHLTAPSLTDPQLKCIPVDAISTDIDGDPRSATQPTRGADEGTDILPLHLLQFTAEAFNKQAALKWTTVNEDNVNEFIVEHSTDGVHFTQQATVKALNHAGNNYYLIYTSLAAGYINYYRLIIKDKDGSAGTSPVLSIDASGKFVWNIYPNPAKNKAVIVLPADLVKAVLNVYDQQGKKIYTATIPGTPYILNTSALSAGIYFAELTTGKNTYRQKLVISR